MDGSGKIMLTRFVKIMVISCLSSDIYMCLLVKDLVYHLIAVALITLKNIDIILELFDLFWSLF